MPSESPQYLIETDVLASYLVSPPTDESLLRLALRQASCYTTMLNALELFRAARTEGERRAVLQLLHIVRVLGFHARYAEQFALHAQEIASAASKVDRDFRDISDRESMILGMAQASKLTILTVLYYERYRSFDAVRVVNSLTDPALLHSQRSTPPARSTIVP